MKSSSEKQHYFKNSGLNLRMTQAHIQKHSFQHFKEVTDHVFTVINSFPKLFQLPETYPIDTTMINFVI